MAPIPPRIVKKDDSLKYLKTEILKLIQSYENLLQLLKKDAWYTSQTYVRIDENWTEEQINALIDVEVGPLEDDIENIQRQVDGQIETWFYNGEPGPLVLPESEWVTIDTQAGNNNERLKHLGDLYYDNSTGYAYRYSNSGTEQSPVFYWNPISDSAVIEALRQASQAQDTADHKRRIFVTANGVLPTPPYSEGDMWINAIYPLNNTEKDWANGKYYNDILRCNVPATYSGGKLVREGVETGEQASISHWSPSSNYTDDTYAHTFDYFKTAMQSGGTQVVGGLILSNTIALRDQNDNIMAGINGLLQTSMPLESIAAWFGGPMVDHEKTPSAQDYAKILFRMDGSGYLAGGLISFDSSGALTTVDLRAANTLFGTIKLGDIYISPDANNNYLEIYKLDANNNKIAAGLVAYGDVSALGAAAGGGGGGSSVLYELNDVRPNNSIVSQATAVYGAAEGNVLTFNEDTGRWEGRTPTAGATSLSALTDVSIGSQTNGQALVWDSTTSKWVPGTISGGVQSDWNQSDSTALDYIKNKPNLSTVATSGSYNDLSNKPSIPSVSASVSGSTLTITINGSSYSLTDTDTWRPIGTGATDAAAGNHDHDSRYLSSSLVSIELNTTGALSGYGGYIDFHFNGSQADYTSRIIEDQSGRLNINSVYVTSTGDLTVGGGDLTINEPVSGGASAIWFQSGGTTKGNLRVKANGELYFYTGTGAETTPGCINAGEIYSYGDVTAASDERLKDIVSRIDLSVGKIACAPVIKFTWKNKQDKDVHAGTIAQYWQEILPEVVSDKAGSLAMNYGAASMVAVISTAREVCKLRERICQLEEELKQLKSA